MISLGEGSTPLLRAPRLSERLGVELWLKWEGVEPDRLLQGPRHDRRRLEGGRGRRRGGDLRLDREHRGLRGGLRGPRRHPRRRAAARGRRRRRQGRADADARGARCSRCAATSTRRSRPRRSSPTAARTCSSTPSTRTAARARRPRCSRSSRSSAARRTCSCSRTAAAATRPRTRRARRARHSATPIVAVEAEHRADDARLRDPDRRARARARASRCARAATVVTVSDEEILAAWRELATVEGLFCEPSSAAGLAALRRGAVAGRAARGHDHRPRPEGPESADRFAPPLDPGRRRPRRDRGRGARGRVIVRAPGDLGQPRRRLRLRRRRARPLERARGDRRRRRRRSRARAPASSPPTTPTSPSARSRCSPTRRASAFASSTGSRSSAGSARRPRRSRSASSPRRRDASAEELLAAGLALESHADNLAAALLGGLTLAWDGKIARIAESLPLAADRRRPAERTSTAASRGTLPATVPHADAAASAGRAALLGAGAASGDATLFAAALDDRLHEPYRPSRVLDAIRDELPPGVPERRSPARARR